MLPANWLTELIKIAASVVLLITIYIVFWPRIKDILGTDDAELRSIELSAEYQDADRELDESKVYRGLVLRHVRSARRDEELICLFVNDGDPALNVQIEAEGPLAGTIEPSDHLKAGHTGSLKLEGWTNNDDISFTLRYEDERGYVYRERYRLTTNENLLCREDDVESRGRR